MNPGRDLYFSVDVETDGPIPGIYSMLSFGIAAAATFDGSDLVALNPEASTFYRELKPISEVFDRDAVAATGIDREAITRTGSDPAIALRDAVNWIGDTTAALPGEANPVFVAYPLGFDWMFFHWYAIRYVGRSPFGHNAALDIKTLYAAHANATITSSTRSQMPSSMLPTRPVTHNALDDAIAQAELFVNAFRWNNTQ